MTDTAAFRILNFIKSDSGPRRPRIALMGEFSAGKSTLANLMIGTDPLPMQVVATRSPPIWISYGAEPPQVVDINGNKAPCDLNDIADMDVEDIAFIQLHRAEQILERCDIIDMPGISDPNMPSEVWERLLPVADGVIWCSPATQAWRRSEAAVWEGVDTRLHENAILLLTRADMLLTAEDRAKVLRRVRGETKLLFRQTVMMALLEARAAFDDDRFWVSSGADDFVGGFLELISRIERNLTDRLHQAGFEADRRGNNGAALSTGNSPHVHARRPIRTNGDADGTALDPTEPESYTPKFS